MGGGCYKQVLYLHAGATELRSPEQSLRNRPFFFFFNLPGDSDDKSTLGNNKIICRKHLCTLPAQNPHLINIRLSLVSPSKTKT